MTEAIETVRKLLDDVSAAGRTALNAVETRVLCDAYGISIPEQTIVDSAEQAAAEAARIGFPVAMKVVSDDVLHKTEAGGVVIDVGDRDAARRTYERIRSNVLAYKPDASIAGVLVQAMVAGGREVLIGGVTDPSFGKLVAFGLGGVFVEVLGDVTFRLAPVAAAEAERMLDDIAGAEVLRGVRGEAGVDRRALADLITRVSQLLADFPAISELDLNPVFADSRSAVAADVRIVLDPNPAPQRDRPSQAELVASMKRIMQPEAVAVIGASAEAGKIGNSVMRNLVDGGYEGAIYPINPKADEILGRRCYRSVADIPGDVDVAIFAIPAKFVRAALEEVGKKKIAGAILIPSGFAEVGEVGLQDELVATAREWKVRIMGPNIYGFYYTPKKLCATFCTPYDVQGGAALSSQSGGVGMSIIGFSRSTGMGVSAIVGLGNKADLDEDDLLTFFEQDDNTQVIAMHAEDLKDGRSFAEVAARVSRSKPIVMLKAGRTAAGARAAASHTGALAGNDRVYDDVLRQCGVIRAHTLNDMLQFARALPVLPTPEGENVVIITGAGGSGVLLSDACMDNDLRLMSMPADLDASFRKFIPPFGAAGNPVDITGGEPPSTYVSTIDLGLRESRIHALVLGYWHTIVTPPMVFARVVVDAVEAARRDGIDKPIVASLVGDVEVEEAAEFLFAHRIPSYPYTTELPVSVLGAKYRWARAAGLLRR